MFIEYLYDYVSIIIYLDGKWYIYVQDIETLTTIPTTADGYTTSNDDKVLHVFFGMV